MAAPKVSSHARSNSLPPSSHPLLACAEEHLQRLKSSEAASPLSHSLAFQNMDGLKNLYECLDDVLRLPLSQQALSDEEVLDGSLRLLDICGAVRDIYSQMKESVQELESSVRRRRNGDLADEVSSYMISKKHLNKMISKCYKELKKAEKNCNMAAVNKDSEKVPLVNLIKEVQEVTLTVLESALSFLSPSKAGSLVLKLFHKKASSKRHSNIPAMEQIEIELNLSYRNKSNIDVLKGLEALESSLQELAEMLEVVFRLLLKIRVTLLNNLTYQVN